MYHGMFGKNHTLAQINIDNPSKKKLMQTGDIDRNILCSSCDNEVIGSYERYASKILLDENTYTETVSLDGMKCFEKPVDYKQLKLFLLSILWRANLTSLQSYKYIDIGQHEECIRNMLFNGAADKSDIFPVSIIKIIPPKSYQAKIIIEPITISLGEHDCCIFYVNGFFYNFTLSKHTTKVLFDSFAIKEDNRLIIPVLENQAALDFLYSFTKKQIWKH